MSDIKFVYFDVGGVSLLDFSETNKWVEMKRALGVSDVNGSEFDSIWKKYRQRICIDCDVDSIVPEFKEINGVTIPDSYSMLIDFVERFEPNPSIWPVIEAAKKRYKVGLLTNMYPRMLETIYSHQLLPDIEWDAIVDSSVVGYQKPQPEMYQKAEEMAGVEPHEIFFVDNSEEHLYEAAKQKWRTFLYDTKDPEESNKKLTTMLGVEL
jgi:HAD superfamily hydrolase (TIGR01549 family)